MTDETRRRAADQGEDQSAAPAIPDTEPADSSRLDIEESGIEPAASEAAEAEIATEPAPAPDEVQPAAEGVEGEVTETVEETVVVVPPAQPAEPDEPAEVPAAEQVPAEPAAVEAIAPAADRFTWHPEHAGKTFEEVRAQLAQDIAADQRQHRLAMDGAEEAEQDALTSVVALERKWGVYDFDWAEQDPQELAGRIVAFEREREQRRELITWADYRSSGNGHDAIGLDGGERPAPELSSGAKALSLLLVVLLIALILIAVWAL